MRVVLAAVLIGSVTALAVLAVGPHDWFAFLFIILMAISMGARVHQHLVWRREQDERERG